MKRYVIAGGPGIGKTTTIAELKRRGYPIIDETSRQVIDESLRANSDLVPWLRLEEFQKEVSERQAEKEAKPLETDFVFMDRSIIDGHAYCIYGNVKVPDIIESFSKKIHYDKVFILDPLPYATDKHRHEDPIKAQKIHHEIIKSYIHFGYEPIFVPVMPIEERVDWILEKIK